MKRILLFAVIGMLLLSLACSEATVHGKTVFYSDCSGTKTVTFRVYGDQEPLEGRDYTAGNNSAFLLSTGDALIEKLKGFCPLPDAQFTYTEGASKRESTYITMSFDFTDINDYNRKGRLLAGNYADGWKDAQCEENGGTLTVREADGNLKLLYLDMLEQYFNDFDCYPVYEYGPNTQSQVIPNGIQFHGDDYFAFSWWIVPASNEIVIGDRTASSSFFDPSVDHEARADLSDSYLEASGVANERVVPVSLRIGEDTQTVYEQNAAFVPGTLIVTYSDGTEQTVALNADLLDGFDTSVSGTYRVGVRCQGLETSFDVTVKSRIRPLHWFLIGFAILFAVAVLTTLLMMRKKKVAA